MKKQNTQRLIFVTVILSLPWLYLAYIWPTLPQTIAVHFGIDGKPDRYGNKSEIFVGPVIITIVALFIYILLINIQKLDPKRYKDEQSAVFVKIAQAVVLFMSGIGLLVLHWSVKEGIGKVNLLLVLIGVFVAYLGNLMHSIKPNYFIGMRLPWTLESENNWRATHLAMSKIWFTGGLLIAILSLIVPTLPLLFVVSGIILAMVVTPIVYSYRYFKKEKKQP